MDRATIILKRNNKIKDLPKYYNPLLHMFGPSIVFISILVFLLAYYEFNIWHLVYSVFIFILLNLGEYIVHRFSFHRKIKLLSFLYEKHTKNHHVLFTDEHMEIINLKEIAYILIPFPTFILFLISILAFGFLINLVSFQFSIFFCIWTIGYFLFYEWSHLFYHLPPKQFGGILHRYLSKYHKIHHNPRYMNWYNFGVTIVIWDRIFKTLKKENY